MKIIINGELESDCQDSTLEDLLIRLDLLGKRIAVEINGEIIPRSRHLAQTLQDGDRLEIVQAIGGG